jgi:hypothetical protein
MPPPAVAAIGVTLFKMPAGRNGLAATSLKTASPYFYPKLGQLTFGRAQFHYKSRSEKPCDSPRGPLRPSLARSGRDLPLLRPFRSAILASKLPGIWKVGFG